MAQPQLHRMLSHVSLEAPAKSFLSHESMENDLSTNTSGLGRNFDEKSVIFKMTKIAMLKSAISEMEVKIHVQRLENRDIVTSEGRERASPEESRAQIEIYLKAIRTLQENYAYYNGYLREKQVRVTEDIQTKDETLANLEKQMLMKSIEFSKVKKGGQKKGFMNTLKKMWN